MSRGMGAAALGPKHFPEAMPRRQLNLFANSHETCPGLRLPLLLSSIPSILYKSQGNADLVLALPSLPGDHAYYHARSTACDQ